MTDALSSLTAATCSFAVLFSVPLTISALSWTLGRLFEDPVPGIGGSAVVAEAKFAAIWSFLVFVPARALLSAAGDKRPLVAAVTVAIGAAAFASSFFSTRVRFEIPGWRLFWAALETILVLLGYFVFDFERQLLQGVAR